LSELSWLKEDDRVDVEGDIILYRNNRTSKLSEPNLTPAETREQLEKLARDAQDLHLEIERALDNDSAAWALTTPTVLAWGAADIWSLSEKLQRCPSSDDLRRFGTLRNGGSGPSGLRG
jgi:hypothetical protein